MIEVAAELCNVIEQVKLMPMKDRPKLVKLYENRKVKQYIKKVNEVIEDIILPEPNLTEVNTINYAAALYIQNKVIVNKNTSSKKGQGKEKKKKKPSEPEWKVKMQKNINMKRKEHSQIVQYLKNPTTKGKLANEIRRLKKKYKINSNQQLKEKTLELKGEIPALAADLRNRQEKINSITHNKEFETNRRQFYKNLTQKKIEVENPPEKEKLDDFWRPMFEKKEKYNENNDWEEIVKQKNEDHAEMEELVITPQRIEEKLKQYPNFKAPGPDKIPNYWLKKINVLHQYYSKCFNKLLNGEEETPEWFTKGETTLIPKTEQTELPNKYRPICCLNTTYKLLTGMEADDIYKHLERNKALENQQKGCRRSCLGTKDQLLINKAIMDDCRKRSRQLSMAWIDYKKAYDNVPHDWILKCLELYKIDQRIINLTKKQMKNWNVNINLKHNNGTINLPDVKVNKGIFQGDSLSPLIFCLCLDPLSKILNEEENLKKGYNMSAGRAQEEEKAINHLLFMDDLKLFANSEENLKSLLQIVEDFSNDINMEFGLDKCAKSVIKKGKKVETENIQLDRYEIQNLDEDTPYKYLGMEENENLMHKEMKKKLRKEYLSRLKKICKTSLTNKNKITAINELAIAILSYSFGIINWYQSELNSLDVKTRKWLTMYKIIYRNQCLSRIYLPRSKGGMGLTEINQLHRATIVSIGQYLRSCNRKEIKMVKEHQEARESDQTSTYKLATVYSEHINEEKETTEKPATVLARKTRAKYTNQWQKQIEIEWKDQKRAAPFYEELNQDYIDKEKSIEWLKKGVLKYDQERLIIAAQDQGLMTRAFMKLAKLTSDDRCRFCKEARESSAHLLSACKVLLGDGYYTERHNRLCRYLHWTICKEYNIEVSDKVWYHQPTPLTGNDEVSIYYDKILPTSSYIEESAVKPDIVVWNRKEKRATIVEVSVPNDLGLNLSERKKRKKYIPLAEDLKRSWKLNTTPDIVPVIIGSLGLMKKNIGEIMDQIPGTQNSLELQIGALLGSCKILKRALAQ